MPNREPLVTYADKTINTMTQNPKGKQMMPALLNIEKVHEMTLYGPMSLLPPGVHSPEQRIEG